jgi:hypothetical protein
MAALQIGEDGGVVDENIHLAEFGDGLGHHVCDRRGIGDIGLYSYRFASLLMDDIHGAGGIANIGGADLGAFGRQRLGIGDTDPPARSRHDGNPIFKPCHDDFSTMISPLIL